MSGTATPPPAVPPPPPTGSAPAPSPLAAQLESFEQLLQVQVTIYDFVGYFQLAGRRLYAEHFHAHDRCAFCRTVKDDFGRMRDCLRCDMEPVVHRSQAPATWRRCHAGVWEVICPLWDGAMFIGVMMVGSFRRAGEGPLIDSPLPVAAPLASPATTAATTGAATGVRAARRKKDQAALTTLRQHHRLLRDLDAATEQRLPALVENFAHGLLRTTAQLKRAAAGAGATATPVGVEAAGSPATTAAAPTPRQERARAVDLFFRTNLAQDIKIADLARYLHLSVARTSQVLRRDLKATFPALLRRHRLGEAKRLLIVSEQPVGRVAELAGFTDRNYFCRVFTRDTGQTPTLFRKQNARPLRA